MPRATFRRGNPQTIYERRLMAHVLIVPTFEFRHPVPLAVAVVAGDAFFHVRAQSPEGFGIGA